jgi:hypothetical protein
MIDEISKSIVMLLYESAVLKNSFFTGQEFRKLLIKHNITDSDGRELSRGKRFHVLRYLRTYCLVEYERGFKGKLMKTRDGEYEKVRGIKITKYKIKPDVMRAWIYRKAEQMKIPQIRVQEVGPI